jgi:hypothetical protein
MPTHGQSYCERLRYFLPTKGLIMNCSMLTATLRVVAVAVTVTFALSACDKQAPMQDAANNAGGIERQRSAAPRVTEVSDTPSIGGAEKSGVVESERASTMRLSYPLERSGKTP